MSEIGSTYKYNLSEVDIDIVKEMIQLSPLRQFFHSIVFAWDNDQQKYELKVSFNKVLYSSEENTLADLMNSYGPNHKFVVRKYIEDNIMNPAMGFGMNFLSKFSANNIYLGKTAIQVNTLLAQYPDLIHAALTGSLNTLLYVMGTMVPSENISQEEIDEFRDRLKIYLNIP